MAIQFPATPFVGQYIWYEGVRYDWNDVDGCWFVAERNREWPEVPDPPGNSPPAYMVEITTSVDDTLLTYNLYPNVGVPAEVDWGDGSDPEVFEGIGSTVTATHTYAAAGVYDIAITGKMYAWPTPLNTADKLLVTKFNGSGSLGLNDFRNLCRNFSNMTDFTFGDGLVDDMTGCSDMLYDCASLVNVDLSGMSNAKPTDLGNLFRLCTSLKTVDVSPIDTSECTHADDVFYSCGALTTVSGLSTWDTRKMVDLSYFFYNCKALTTHDLVGWDLPSPDLSLNGLFYGCELLTTIDLSSLQNCQPKTASVIFAICRGVTSAILPPNFVTSNCTNISAMITGCRELTSFDTSGWDVSNCGSLRQFADGCTKLTFLDVSGWDTSNITDMAIAFQGTPALQGLDLTGWNFEALTTGTTSGLKYFFTASGNANQLGAGGLDALYPIIAAQNLTPGIDADFGLCKYTSGGAGETARAELIADPNNWNLTDGGTF